jgi:hypothetical protein
MKKLILAGIVALVAQAAVAAPNRADTSQLGSVQGFPYVVAKAGVKTTLIRLVNTNPAPRDVRCQYRDNLGTNVAITPTIPGNAPYIFDVSTVFPNGGEGFMWCWAISGNDAVRWNYLLATATIVEGGSGGPKWEYSAWSFAARQGTDGNPVPGNPSRQIRLNANHFDNCAEYLIGQYSPSGTTAGNTITGNTTAFGEARFAAIHCTVDLRLSLASILTPFQTSMTLTMLSDQGVAQTGVKVTCVGTWHETSLPTLGQFGTTKTVAYRVQSLGGATGCSGLPKLGLIGVQMSTATANAMPSDRMGSSLTITGQRNGLIRW